MFKKLRNKLILINVVVTTILLIFVFSSIYIIYTHSANSRPPLPPGDSKMIRGEEMENYIEITIQNEKNTAARELLIMLLASSIAIEIIVILVSYYLAEEAIKPIRDAYESQKLFIANASHEIKTPLAAISANLEAADIHGNKWINNVEKETTKLTVLNNSLLALTRTGLIEKSQVDDVDLEKTVSGELSSFEPRLKNIKLEKRINVRKKNTLVRTDFVQIFNILMDNAIKYCDKKIQISLDNHSLTVINDGATISEKDLPHVFERFYQADKSAEGVGLGLAIAQSVALRNGWTLTAKSANNETEFKLKF